MEQPTMRIGIEPGPGLVGRFGDTVILIPRGEAAAGPDETARELLSLAAEVASDRQAPASAIAGRLAAWVIGHLPGDAAAFGIVVPMRDGVVMFLRGAVRCTITEGGSTREVSGEQALTWVDQIVPGTFERLAIGSVAGRAVQADPLSDLSGGVVPGQGFVWSPSQEAPGEAAGWPQEAWALRADAQNQQLTMVVRTGESEQAPSRAESGPAEADRPAVEALRPSPPVQPTVVAPAPSRPVAAPPPLGVLTSEDEPPIVLDRGYVLGREPHQDPAVESGEATPVQLQDPDHVISRVHAYVAVENGIVLVRDVGSMHGTYLSPPGGEEWTRIGTEPSPLPPGWSFRIGPRVFTYKLTEPVDEQ